MICGTSTFARAAKLKVQIVDFPGGVPGEIGMTLSWS
jgi:hypothetical protein